MPAVADAVGAPTTSVYWHFRTRDDLVAAVAERVTRDLYASLPPVAHEDSWEDEFFNYFTAFRRHIHDHPAFLELFTPHSRTLLAYPAVDSLITKRLEGELGVLVRAGASPQDAYRIYTIFSLYVRGFVTIELGASGDDDGGAARAVTVARHLALDPAEYPVMSAIPDIAALAMGHADDVFQAGLRILVNGTKEELQLARTADARL